MEGGGNMGYLMGILAAYLIGCSNMAYYVAKLKKADMQKHGSGNLGASNATVLFGWGAGVLVAVHDIGKGVLAVLLAQLVFPDLPYIGAAAGVACVLGHIFPFYLKFKGGKGLGSFIGMSLALNWKIALAALIVLVLATLITDYIVFGTLGTILVVPVGMGIAFQNVFLPLIILIATAVIIGKHLENFRRILKGTEIGLRSTIQGENRIK